MVSAAAMAADALSAKDIAPACRRGIF